MVLFAYYYKYKIMYIAYVKIGLQEVFKIQIIIFLLHNMLIVAFFMVTYTGHMASFPQHRFPAYNSSSCAVFETRYAVFLLALKLAVPSYLRVCAHILGTVRMPSCQRNDVWRQYSVGMYWLCSICDHPRIITASKVNKRTIQHARKNIPMLQHP